MNFPIFSSFVVFSVRISLLLRKRFIQTGADLAKTHCVKKERAGQCCLLPYFKCDGVRTACSSKPKFQPDPARIYGSKLSEINCFRQPEHNLFFLQPDPGVNIHGIYIPAVPLSKVNHIR